MAFFITLYDLIQSAFERARRAEGLAPLLLRLILAPVMLQAGWNKLAHFSDTVAWFEHGLGLPAPLLMATLAVSAEIVGGACLLLGFATRFAAVPLMVTMLVAMTTVHWPHGWHAIADASSWLANDRVAMAAAYKREILDILRMHGDYERLTSAGPVTILNNGIEFAAIYFAMLLTLFFTGGGRYTSVDYWVARRFGAGALS
ncbi:MAG: DoxX family protein [Gammaproteobacteria bacterium]|nr:DoxX family protein [Gammaproteobacteria bacterium]